MKKDKKFRWNYFNATFEHEVASEETDPNE